MARKPVSALLASAALFSASACAQQASPVGLWRSIDDQSGKPRALIRITEQNGEYRGKVEKIFLQPDEPQNPVCIACDGERKDQPIMGMTILTGLKQQGDEYTGGQILDPANGKVYRSKMTLADNGRKLDVRGYIGVPMLGRTQTWIRVE